MSNQSPRRKAVDQRQLAFNIKIPEQPVEPTLEQLRRPIWTENKAKLIERYLYYFVLVTKHGTYIDGFAGPQSENNPDMWTAKLVLESEPRWFRNFYLIDSDRRQVVRLRQLKKEQPAAPKRRILVYRGDCNVIIPELIASKKIPQEASFCLFDQRTFECAWSTVKSVARYKKANKIEIFYFFMNAWFHRSIAAQQDKSVLQRWWGCKDWEKLLSSRAHERARIISERFRSELGYASAKPWPIYEKAGGGHIMYYMIHATDHPAAPKLMRRAYEQAVGPRETHEQMELWCKQELSNEQ